MDPVERWCELVREAYLLARARRLHELRGKYVKTFDGRGLHPYSVVWGQILLLMPEGLEADCSPNELDKAAREEADEIFRAQLLEEARSDG